MSELERKLDAARDRGSTTRRPRTSPARWPHACTRPGRAGAGSAQRWPPAAAVLAAAGALLAVSPGARSAVLDLLEVAGVSIERVPELPEVEVRTAPYFGARTTLADARFDAAHPVLLPRLGDLERPDRVYFNAYPPGGAVVLLYGSLQHPRLVITQWSGETVEPVFYKVAGPGTRVTRVTVDGERGVWLEGAPHLVYTMSRQRRVPGAALPGRQRPGLAARRARVPTRGGRRPRRGDPHRRVDAVEA